MYGSQTGVAESIAKGLHEKIVLANTSGSLETVIVECNRYKRTGLKNGIFDEKRVLSCSTTGNADAPDNCERFGDTSSVDRTQRTCLRVWSIVF